MKRALAAVAIIGAALAFAAPAEAHHSVAGIFDSSKNETLEGRLVKIDWINPHTYVFVDAIAKDGAVTKWQFESLTPAFLRRAGLTKELMMADGGKPVTVTYEPPRNIERTGHLGHIVKITYADGHSYQLGAVK